MKIRDFIKHGGLPIGRGRHLYWNTLEGDVKYWGFTTGYYDGPIPMFGIWFFHWYIWG